jgi:hypothetical protein
VRGRVTAGTAMGLGVPTFRSTQPVVGATSSKSEIGRSTGASSISTPTMRAKTRRAIPGSTRNKRVAMGMLQRRRRVESRDFAITEIDFSIEVSDPDDRSIGLMFGPQTWR